MPLQLMWKGYNVESPVSVIQKMGKIHRIWEENGIHRISRKTWFLCRKFQNMKNTVKQPIKTKQKPLK